VVLAGRNTAWAANGSWSATTDLDAIDGENAAIVLQNGRVLVVGTKYGQQAAEIYDPASATWSRQADPILLRYEDSDAVLLLDGRVLIVAGDLQASNKRGEVFDPSNGSWTVTADLNIPRWHGKVAALPDGRVLIAGGTPVGSIDPMRDAEIYDPATDTWTLTGSMGRARPVWFFKMVTLQDGTVLAAGGDFNNITSEVYDPGTGIWSPAGALLGANQQFTLTALPDGRAFAVGGPNTHHLYDPLSRTWRSVTTRTDQFWLTATLLQDGTVLVAGTDYIATGGSAVFDPSTETWQITGGLLQRPRQHHSAVLLNDGTVLIVGGYYYGPPCDEGTCTGYTLGSAEIFTPDGA
jgi:hypothetical protein